MKKSSMQKGELELKLTPRMSTIYDCDVMITELFDKALFSDITTFVKHYTKVFVITDQTVAKLYGNLLFFALQKKGIETVTVAFTPGEKTKSFLNAYKCWTKMQNGRFDRKSCVIAFGGGVISDLAGFVAACFMRGIDVINIPTTLIGMVDASIGGKTAINTEEGKNLIGCFHTPKKVYICTELLKTLSPRDFRSGLAEVIKYGIISDSNLFAAVKDNLSLILDKDQASLLEIVQRCCALKEAISKEDPLDNNGNRNILNFGHTFAHALEVATQYRLKHGEAVALGMQLANIVGYHLGITPLECVVEVKALVTKMGFSLQMPISTDQLLHLMTQDKKCIGGKIHLIIAEKIGKVVKVQDVKKRQIKDALQWGLREFNG